MTSSVLVKPPLHGPQGKRLQVTLLVVAESCSFLKFGVDEPRKKAYAYFYRNYDSMKDSEEIREASIKVQSDF